jgi:CubicO group peptidase (beta-lactamase class C family)
VGLGFHLSGEGDGLSFWHTGGTWGSSCVLWAYPETGQGAVVMTNKADDGSGSILFEILFSIAREYGWPVKGS